MIHSIAYSESVAMDQLEEYFDGESGLRSRSTLTKCNRCKIVFAIILPARDHPDNAKYVMDLTRLISEDCINGMHQREYVLESA